MKNSMKFLVSSTFFLLIVSHSSFLNAQELTTKDVDRRHAKGQVKEILTDNHRLYSETQSFIKEKSDADKPSNNRLTEGPSVIAFENLKSDDVGLHPYESNNAKSEVFLNRYPEEGNFKNPNNDQSFELINMRDKFTKYFQNPDGTISASRSMLKPYHFEKDGELLTYDESIVLQNSRYQMKNTDNNIFINQTNGAATMEFSDENIYFLNDSKTYFSFTGGLQAIAFNRANSTVNVNDKSIIFQNYFSNNIDKRYKVSYGTMRYDYIINSQPDIPADAEFITYSETLKLPEGWKILADEGFMGEKGWQGSLQIVDANDNHQLSISPARIYDSFKSQTFTEILGEYSWYEESETIVLELTLPTSYLTSEDRVYPVVVDPTYTLGPSTYSTSAVYSNTGFSSTCGYGIDWSGWTGEDISGYTSTYDVYAVSPAWASEQRTRINYGATQSGSGYGNVTHSYSVSGQTDLNGVTNGTVTISYQAYQTYYNLGGCYTSSMHNMSNWVTTVTYALVPLIQTSGTPSALSACQGVASSSSSFSISGTNMTAGILVSAPSGFEISTDNSNFSSSFTVGSSGTISSTTIYVRLASSASGTPSGNVSLSSSGASSVTVAVSGSVLSAPSNANAGSDENICNGGSVQLSGSATAATSTANTSIFSEGFESAVVPPTSWTQYPGTNGLGTAQQWSLTSVERTGSFGAVSSYENVSGGLAEDWLVTPQIDLSNSVNSSLTFYYTDRYTSNYGSTLDVRVSSNSQTTHSDFTLLGTYNENNNGYVYVLVTIDLSAYDGQSIYIAFVHSNDDGDQMRIDDIDVSGDVSTVLPVTYSWSPSTGLNADNISNPSATPASTTTYTMTATSNGCTSTATATVNVTAAPDAGTLSGTEAVCSNGSTTFSSDGDAGAWSSGSTGVATIDASTGAVTPVSAGSSVMTYTVTGTGGCSDATATRTATVTAAPNAGTLTGTQSICLGGTTTLSSDGDAGAWSSGSTGVATIDASTGVVTPVSAGSSVMTYTVSGSGGCSDATATRTVTVGEAPTISTTTDLTTAANTCGVTELTIEHSGTGGNGEWTYSGGTVAFTSGSSTDALISVRPIPGDENKDITMIWTVAGGEACDGSSISKVIRFNQPTAISSPDTYCYLWGGLTSTDITTGDNWYKWNATTGVDMWERQSSPPGASTDKLNVLTTDNNCIHATNTPIYASSATATSLNVTSGTEIAVNSGTLSISGDADVVGTVTIASGAVLDVDGDFDATGGNVTFSGAGTLQVSSTTTSFGTLTTTAGTVKYDGSSAQTIFAGDYYNLDIDGSGTKSLAGNTTVNGDITLTDGELDFDGNRNLNVIGDITKTSGALVNSSGTNGYLVLKATSSQNASQALCGFTAPSVSIKVQQSADVEITGDISANYLWVQSNNSGTFTIDNDYDLTVDQYIKVAGGILNVVTGSLTTTQNSSSNHELTGGTLDIDGGTVSFGSASDNTTDLNIDGGILDISGGTLNVSDCIDITTGTFTQSGGIVNVKTNTSVNGDSDHKFAMDAGTLNLTGGTMNLLGEVNNTSYYSMSVAAGVTTNSTSGHTIAVSTNDASGDEDRYIDMGDASNDIGNLTFDLAGHELYFITNTDILGDLTATNGDIDVSSLTVNVAGNAEFTNDDLKISTGILDVDGTFNSPNNTTFSDAGRLQLSGTVSDLGTMTNTVGTVEYDGGAQDIFQDTYFNLEIDGSGIKTLPTGNITVNGDLSLTEGSLNYNTGSSSKFVTLKGSVLGTGTITASTTSIFSISGDGTNQDIRGISSDDIGVRLANSANATTSGDITCKYLDLLSSSTGTFTIDGETVTINPTGGYLEMDGGDLTVSSGSLIINSTSETTNELDAGTLTVSGGTVTFTGNSSSNTGGDLNVDGGTLTVSAGSISINDELDVGSGTINQTGGAIYVDAAANNTSGSSANKFDMATGSLNLSGGTLYLQSQASSTYNCINLDETGVTSNITTGHTIDIGTNSTAKNMYFNFGGHSIGNLTVNLPAKNAYFRGDENIQGNVNIIDGTLVVDTHNPSVAGSTTVSGTLKIGAGSYDANGTFDASTGTIDFNNGNGQLYVSNSTVTSFGALDDATGTVVYDGTSAQTIDEAETFYSLKVDNSSGVTLNEAVGVNGTLNMTSGNIVNPSNVLTVGSSAGAGSISHTSGIVTGKLRQYFANATGSKLFPIGNSTIMRDVTVDFTSAPGANQYLTASYNAGHPQANDGSDLYSGLPLTTADGQLIQNYDDDGYWEIIPGSSSTGDSYSASINAKAYNVSLHCNDLTGADNVTNMDRTKVRVIKSAGPGHTSWEALTHVSVSGTDADFTLTGSGTGFSFFGAGTDDSNALPVELVSFNGSCNDGVVDLIWQTASENNSEDFEVAYSRDGIDWDLIHTEPAAGFSTELISYTYEHKQAISGDNYYRLTQNDIDGASVIYDNLIINASCQSTSNGYFSIFPNPSSGSFQVVMNNPEIEGAANLNITDTKGNRVFTKKIVVNSGINMYVIQQELAPGIYYINVENGSRTTTIVKHSIR